MSNGEKLISKRVAVRKSGREWCRVTVELRETKDGPELSMQAEGGPLSGSPRSGGYIPGLGTIQWAGQATAEAERFFPGLRATWDRWHLNGMRAACEHQRASGWLEIATEKVTLYHWRIRPELAKERRDLVAAAERKFRRGEAVQATPDEARLLALPDKATTTTPEAPVTMTLDGEKAVEYVANGPQYEGDNYNRPTEVKALGWLREDEHPRGILSRACPTCGYRYWNAWLFEPLPADVIEWAKVFDGSPMGAPLPTS